MSSGLGILRDLGSESDKGKFSGTAYCTTCGWTKRWESGYGILYVSYKS